jgi:membrane protein DedA with SNARE-associated domain
MFDWIIPSVINIVYSLGYFGIALMMFLENLSPPIPSELIMPLAGFTAQASLKKLADKYGKWITVSSKDITKSIEWFDRQDSKAVFIGRLLPGVRTLISVGVRVLVTCRCHLSYFIQHWVAHCGHVC